MAKHHSKKEHEHKEMKHAEHKKMHGHHMTEGKKHVGSAWVKLCLGLEWSPEKFKETVLQLIPLYEETFKDIQELRKIHGI